MTRGSSSGAAPGGATSGSTASSGRLLSPEKTSRSGAVRPPASPAALSITSGGNSSVSGSPFVLHASGPGCVTGG